MPNLERPADFVLPEGITGVDIVMMIDGRTQMNQECMIYLLENANQYMRTLFTPEEARTLKDNSIWWNQPYAMTKLGVIPEPFTVHEGKLFIHYHPT